MTSAHSPSDAEKKVHISDPRTPEQQKLSVIHFLISVIRNYDRIGNQLKTPLDEKTLKNILGEVQYHGNSIGQGTVDGMFESNPSNILINRFWSALQKGALKDRLPYDMRTIRFDESALEEAIKSQFPVAYNDYTVWKEMPEKYHAFIDSGPKCHPSTLPPIEQARYAILSNLVGHTLGDKCEMTRSELERNAFQQKVYHKFFINVEEPVFNPFCGGKEQCSAALDSLIKEGLVKERQKEYLYKRPGTPATFYYSVTRKGVEFYNTRILTSPDLQDMARALEYKIRQPIDIPPTAAAPISSVLFSQRERAGGTHADAVRPSTSPGTDNYKRGLIMSAVLSAEERAKYGVLLMLYHQNTYPRKPNGGESRAAHECSRQSLDRIRPEIHCGPPDNVVTLSNPFSANGPDTKKALESLVKEGMINERTSQGKSRRVYLSITDKGKQFCDTHILRRPEAADITMKMQGDKKEIVLLSQVEEVLGAILPNDPKAKAILAELSKPKSTEIS